MEKVANVPTFGGHIVPRPEHPLYEHLQDNTFYRVSSLARHALLRHVRFTPNDDIEFHLGSIASMSMSTIGNEPEWMRLFDAMEDDHKTLQRFLNAAEYWTMLAFGSADEYYKYCNDLCATIAVQYTGKIVLPKRYHNEFDPIKTAELLVGNPLCAFLVLLFLSGPLTEDERAVLITRT